MFYFILQILISVARIIHRRFLSPLTNWSDFIDNDAFFVVRQPVDDELRWVLKLEFYVRLDAVVVYFDARSLIRYKNVLKYNEIMKPYKHILIDARV